MRILRPYLPGGVFHITARTLNQERWLEPEDLREFALHALTLSLKRTDADLIAFAIMTNHLHLVIRQGCKSPGQLMQPLLRRLALRMQKHYGRTGRMFGTRYWAETCTDPEYLRQLILYVNINAPRAGLCAWEKDYRWSSHSAYLGILCDRTENRVVLERLLTPVLGVFSSVPGRDPDQLRSDYAKHVARERKRIEENAPQPNLQTDDGDEYWSGEFAHRERDYGPHPRPALSVDEIAKQILKKNYPGLDLDWLITFRGGHQVVKARKEIIERALMYGHRPKTIAACLCISEATVSKVRSAMTPQTFVRYAPFPRTLL